MAAAASPSARAPFAGFLQHLYANICAHPPHLLRKRSIDRAASVCAILRVPLPNGVIAPRSLDEMMTALWLRTVEPELLYVKRAINPRDRWSGNVAFPGGKQDPGETTLETAIREAREEVGLDLTTDFWLMGQLDDRKTNGRSRGPNLVVSLFVFVQIPGQNPKITLQTTELADARWLPLSTYASPDKAVHVVPYSALLSYVHFGKLLTHAFALCGLRAVEFPAVRFPPLAVKPDSIDPTWEYELWGLTLGMTAELLAAGGQATITLESNSSLPFMHPTRPEIRIIFARCYRRVASVTTRTGRYRWILFGIALALLAWHFRRRS